MENASPAIPQNLIGQGQHSETFGQTPNYSKQTAADQQWFHRIGGGNIENLRLKAKEESLNPPGISLLQSSTAKEAADEIRAAFPRAAKLLEESRQIGSITMARIREAGFDVVPASSRRLSNHYRLTHPDGVAGFCDANLASLAAFFITSEVP